MSGRLLVLLPLLAAAGIDLLAPLLLATRYPNYSHLHDAISVLGARGSPVQQLQSSALVAVGALLLGFAVGQAASFRAIGRAHAMYLIGIFAFAIGSVLAGLFPLNPPGAPESPSGRVHGIGSGLGTLLLTLSPLWALRIHEFARGRLFGVLLALLAVVSFLLFLASGTGIGAIARYGGLFQRLNLAALYGFLVLFFLAQDR